MKIYFEKTDDHLPTLTYEEIKASPGLYKAANSGSSTRYFSNGTEVFLLYHNDIRSAKGSFDEWRFEVAYERATIILEN